MKHVLAICIVSVVFMACDPASAFLGCKYYYPIQAINLRDSIKTTDTIWIDTKLPAQLCLQEGIYKNGKGEQVPYFYKYDIETDTLYKYAPIVIGFDKSWRNQNNELLYQINFTYANEEYVSKFGIVFPEPGIYLLDRFNNLLANGVDREIFMQGYFNVESNNSRLYTKKAEDPVAIGNEPKRFYGFYVKVIE